MRGRFDGSSDEEPVASTSGRREASEPSPRPRRTPSPRSAPRASPKSPLVSGKSVRSPSGRPRTQSRDTLRSLRVSSEEDEAPKGGSREGGSRGLRRDTSSSKRKSSEDPAPVMQRPPRRQQTTRLAAAPSSAAGLRSAGPTRMWSIALHSSESEGEREPERPPPSPSPRATARAAPQQQPPSSPAPVSVGGWVAGAVSGAVNRGFQWRDRKVATGTSEPASPSPGRGAEAGASSPGSWFGGVQRFAWGERKVEPTKPQPKPLATRLDSDDGSDERSGGRRPQPSPAGNKLRLDSSEDGEGDAGAERRQRRLKTRSPSLAPPKSPGGTPKKEGNGRWHWLFGGSDSGESDGEPEEGGSTLNRSQRPPTLTRRPERGLSGGSSASEGSVSRPRGATLTRRADAGRSAVRDPGTMARSQRVTISTTRRDRGARSRGSKQGGFGAHLDGSSDSEEEGGRVAGRGRGGSPGLGTSQRWLDRMRSTDSVSSGGFEGPEGSPGGKSVSRQPSGLRPSREHLEGSDIDKVWQSINHQQSR